MFDCESGVVQEGGDSWCSTGPLTYVEVGGRSKPGQGAISSTPNTFVSRAHVTVCIFDNTR